MEKVVNGFINKLGTIIKIKPAEHTHNCSDILDFDSCVEDKIINMGIFSDSSDDSSECNSKIDKVTTATPGNIAIFNSEGGLEDSNKSNTRLIQYANDGENIQDFAAFTSNGNIKRSGYSISAYEGLLSRVALLERISSYLLNKVQDLSESDSSDDDYLLQTMTISYYHDGDEEYKQLLLTRTSASAEKDISPYLCWYDENNNYYWLYNNKMYYSVIAQEDELPLCTPEQGISYTIV